MTDGREEARRRETHLRAALLGEPLVFQRLVPAAVRGVLARLEEGGHEAYLVGGCVRDLLLGRPPKDWDVATSARPEQVMALFARTRPTGIRHGTVTVLSGGRAVEVTTYRVEGTYSDHRRPDWVEFTDRLEADLARRDFTINALALSPRGRLVDPFGGRQDLARGIVRAVGDPRARFREDALRMVRAVRFAAQLGFALDPDTRAAIGELHGLLVHVSWERIRDELVKILLSDHVAWALETMRETGLLGYILPELLEGVGVAQNVHHRYTVWEHNVRACAAAPPVLHLRLAALLHDVAKPRCLTVDERGERHFYHHEVVGAEMANAILRRLRFDNETRERVVHLVRHHLALHLYRDMTDAGVRRLIRRVGLEHLDDLVKLRIADRMASGTKRTPLSRGTRLLLRRIERVLKEDAAFGLKDLAVDGHDVMRVLGIGPGPAVGAVLRALLEAVLDDPSLNTRERLEELIRAKGRELGVVPPPGEPEQTGVAARREGEPAAEEPAGP